VTTVRPVERAPDAVATRRSLVERSKLRRELGRLAAICLLIAAIVVLDTLGAVAKGGAQTLVWLAVVAVLFFVPAGPVVAELGAAFPNQGGPYVWARLAFGRYTGSLVSLIYFVETPVWVGGSAAITCVAVVDRLLVPLEGGWRVPVALAFVWATVALAVAPLRAGKRVPLAGAAAQVALLGFFTLTVGLYAARHGVHAPSAGDLAPSWAVFAVVAPVLAIVLVVPAERLTGLTGFIDALATVFVVYGPWEGLVGALAALALLWIVVANGLTWVMASSRTQAAASVDGIGPAVLGRVSARTGTPVVATLAGALVVIALATGWSAVALAAALWPGLGTADPDAYLPDGFTGQRLAFTLAELVPLALVLAAAFLLARPARRHERAPTAEGARA
jgi:glutamate:GABA antiporter